MHDQDTRSTSTTLLMKSVWVSISSRFYPKNTYGGVLSQSRDLAELVRHSALRGLRLAVKGRVYGSRIYYAGHDSMQNSGNDGP